MAPEKYFVFLIKINAIRFGQADHCAHAFELAFAF
jgi:hypothetical protein